MTSTTNRITAAIRHGVARWVVRPVRHPDLNASVGVLSINGTAYAYCRLHGAGVIRLTKSDGVTYQVARNPETGCVECDCPDAVYRPGTRCKHVGAVLAALTGGKNRVND